MGKWDLDSTKPPNPYLVLHKDFPRVDKKAWKKPTWKYYTEKQRRTIRRKGWLVPWPWTREAFRKWDVARGRRKQ